MELKKVMEEAKADLNISLQLRKQKRKWKAMQVQLEGGHLIDIENAQ